MDALPKFDLPLIERRRERLRTVFLEACGEPVTTVVFQQLLRRLQGATSASRDVLTESLRHLLDRTLTPGDAFKLAWRFAGNLERLQAGQPVRPWSVQAADEWVPLQVLSVYPAKNRHDETGSTVKLRVLAGTPCPMVVDTFWKRGLMSALSRRVGFTRPSGLYPYQRSDDFVGLRLLGKIEAIRSQRQPQFFEVGEVEALRRWNRANVLTYRTRTSPTQGCPRGFQHDCHRCAIGYVSCPGGTHMQDYTVGACAACGSADAVFDTDLSAEVCRTCAIAARLKT